MKQDAVCIAMACCLIVTLGTAQEVVGRSGIAGMCVFDIQLQGMPPIPVLFELEGEMDFYYLEEGCGVSSEITLTFVSIDPNPLAAVGENTGRITMEHHSRPFLAIREHHLPGLTTYNPYSLDISTEMEPGVDHTQFQMTDVTVERLDYGSGSIRASIHAAYQVYGTMVGVMALPLEGIDGDPAIPSVECFRFKRGDSNASNNIDIADAVFTLSYLFAEGLKPSCLDAADTNDSGDLDIADVVRLLSYLFASGAPLPEPLDDCGVDPTPRDDKLDCASFPPCQRP
jgi:hypothetical protein